MDQEEAYKAAKQYAYALLARRDYLSQELEKKLETKGFSPEIQGKIVKECQRQGYVKDKKTIESLVRSLAASDKGPHFILKKLLSKGVTYEVASEAVEEYDLASERIERIQGLVTRKYHDRERHKTVAALVRRGYTLDEIWTAIAQFEES